MRDASPPATVRLSNEGDGPLEIEGIAATVADSLGRIVAARVADDALRSHDVDDFDLLAGSPLLAYLHPGRFASIEQSNSFPFPAGMKK